MVLVEISVVEVSGSVVGVSSVEEAKEDVTSVDVKVDTCSDETEEDSVKSVGSVVLSVTELGEDDDDDSANSRIMKTYCIITEHICFTKWKLKCKLSQFNLVASDCSCQKQFTQKTTAQIF
jgi:hypothetical protein